MAMTYPWSSSGASAVGTDLDICQVASSMMPMSTAATTPCRINHATPAMYLPVKPANPVSKTLRIPRGSIAPVFRNRAHMAGVSVSATNPEIDTDTAIVIAN